MLLLYDVDYVNEHEMVYVAIIMTTYLWYHIKKNFTYDIIPCLLDFVGLWGFTWSLHLYIWDEVIGKYFVC